jgi:dimethylhistidine N-methyltransferase
MNSVPKANGSCKTTSANGQFARDVLFGLTRTPKTIPSMYLYDDAGSQLFEQIIEIEEYYLGRCELEILRTYADQLATRLGPGPFRLVELGAGDGRKTEILLQHFLDRKLDFDYVPVDICEETIVRLGRSLLGKLPEMSGRIHGIVAEYFDAIARLDGRHSRPIAVLFLGSNIGNFEPGATLQFLRSLRESLHVGDNLLIGFDLKKDVDLLLRAYNDRQGVTSQFNFNLLERMNRELDAGFDRGRFLHYGPYNPDKGRMESWLVSREDQTIWIGALGRAFSLRAWEGIRVECSYKYDVTQIAGLAAAAGFRVEQHFLDRRSYFADSLWGVGR